MNLEYFHSFIETAGARSISKAAGKLNISQPALSKQIERVEDFFGVQLLVRTSSGVEVTQAGEALLERIPPVLAEIRRIQEELQELHRHRIIKTGSLPSLAAYYLPQRILALKNQNVTVETIVMNTSEELLQALDQGVIDAALVEDKYVRSPYHARRLFAEHYYAVVPTGHDLGMSQLVSWEDIWNEPFVLYPPQCDIRRTITEEMAKQGHEPDIRFEVSFGEMILGYVAAGAGITIVPEIIVNHMNHLPLRAVQIRGFELERRISLVSRSKVTGEYLYRGFIHSLKS